jgi:hypothetical protein
MEGKLLMMEQERSFKSPDVVRFLRHLLRQIPGKLLIIWDGSPIHRGRAVKEFLASGSAEDRLKLEQLPGYAPDLKAPMRESLKASEVRGTQERLLPEPFRTAHRAAKGQGAFETQKRRHSRFHQTARLRGLGGSAEVIKGFAEAKQNRERCDM